MKKLVAIILIFSSLKAQAFVKDPVYDDLEGYELVTVLIRDGKLDLAREELQRPEIRKTDVSRYQLLLGQWHFAKEEYKKAVSELKDVKKGAHFDTAQLFTARSYFFLKTYSRCVSSFDQVPMLTVAIENDYILKAQCEFQDKKMSAAWATLIQGQKRFNSFTIARESIGLKIQLQMIHEALTQSLDWFARSSGFPSQYLDVAEAFHQKGASDAAIAVLETGRSQYPMHLDINLTLSQLYFQKNLLMASEDGFSRAASTDAKYFYHTAEVNRQLGRFERAQYFNGYVQDPKEKIKQKIAGYVDAGRFPMIASLESVLSRSELSQDDEIKYALAYSLVKMGQIEEPLKYLSSITRPDLLEKTTALRKTLIDCQSTQKSCPL